MKDVTADQRVLIRVCSHTKKSINFVSDFSAESQLRKPTQPNPLKTHLQAVDYNQLR